MRNPDAIPEICIVTTTVGSMEDATRLARTIVERRYGACVQLDAIASSIYAWDGKVCVEPEVRLTIKTIEPLLEVLEAYFAQAHPYEVPQFVVTSAAASKGYGNWVSESVAFDA